MMTKKETLKWPKNNPRQLGAGIIRFSRSLT
jgi:hypothetical protein